LHEKKRIHESIIIKTALATTKGSQTPAEASAEAILDKLAEVKNDAKTQHSSSTTEVTNFQVTAESTTQSITEARIIAIRLISFINEGEKRQGQDGVSCKNGFSRSRLPMVKPSSSLIQSLLVQRFGRRKKRRLQNRMQTPQRAPACS